GFDIWVLPLQGDRKPWSFLKTSFNEKGVRFSPDGRWLSYMSDESGRPEVYIRRFIDRTSPDSSNHTADTIGGQWQVSIACAIYPLWRPDGKEMYYIAPDGRMMAASITIKGETVEPGTPVALFQTQIYGGGVDNSQGFQYDIARDGRFLINTV